MNIWRRIFRRRGDARQFGSGVNYRGRPIAIDPEAVSTESGVPAFIARPPDAPVYYGFPVLEDLEVDGFKFGIITDFEAEPTDYGDAFVVAPDGSRAGLMWAVEDDEYFEQVMPLERDRWGVWAVGITHPIATREDARRVLELILPSLREKWESWRMQYRRKVR